MVDISGFIDPVGDDADDGAVAEDLVALKACLQALADAIASTNLAVISSNQGDAAGATARVQASVAGLKRFHEAFVVLDRDPGEEVDDEED
jgi:hypothetical protein